MESIIDHPAQDIGQPKWRAALSALQTLGVILRWAWTDPESQHAKIEQHVLDNLDDFTTSDQFASIEADALMFGEAAVIRRKDE